MIETHSIIWLIYHGLIVSIYLGKIYIFISVKSMIINSNKIWRVKFKSDFSDVIKETIQNYYFKVNTIIL